MQALFQWTESKYLSEKLQTFLNFDSRMYKYHKNSIRILSITFCFSLNFILLTIRFIFILFGPVRLL
jgi:hypothetical protein